MTLNLTKLFTFYSPAGNQLSDEFWFHFYCLGPDRDGLGKCDRGDQAASYIPAMLRHVVGASHLSWDSLVGSGKHANVDVARVIVTRLI